MCQHCEDLSRYARQVHNFFCSFLSLFQICSCIWADCVKKNVFVTQLAKRHNQISLTRWYICYLLRVCRDWIEFSSQQALEVLTHVESLASTLYSSAFDTRANLLRSLCFALLYSATHYLAAVWLDSRHDFNIILRIH